MGLHCHTTSNSFCFEVTGVVKHTFFMCWQAQRDMAGLTGDVGDGLMIAGISEAISGLIGSSLLQTRQQRKERPELESEAPKKNQVAGGVTW